FHHTTNAENYTRTLHDALPIFDQTVTAPSAALHADTGSSASDRITNNGQIDVTLASDMASWQYSTDGGGTWTTGSGTSFTLAPGSQAGKPLNFRHQVIADTVSS